MDKIDGNFEIGVEGTSLGEPVTGKITGTKAGELTKVQVNLEKGNKKMIQLDTKMKLKPAEMKFDARTKYSIMGGVIQGQTQVKFENGVLTLKNTASDKSTLELSAAVVPGQSLNIEGKKNGESMRTYKTKRTTTRNNDVFDMTLDTEMTLSQKSKVYKFLTEKYPYGAFSTRSNKLTIHVDKKNRNKLAPKFKVEAHLKKDGELAVDLIADTTVSPYKFNLVAPNFFKRWGISQKSIDITADHQIDKSLVIDANIFGGLHFKAEKGGVQMIKLTWSTEKINNANEFKFILHDTLEVNPDSILYKKVISQYKILTPFNKRSGEYEFYVNKKDKNTLFRKFSVKGKVMKDNEKAMQLLMTTNEKP